MTAKIILLFIAITIVILLMTVHHDGVIALHSQLVDYMERRHYNNTFTTLLPVTDMKNLNDTRTNIIRLSKKKSGIKDRNAMITYRKNRNNTITNIKNRSNTITDREIRNNTILGRMSMVGTIGFHSNIYRNRSQQNLKTPSEKPDIPNTSPLIEQSTGPGNTKTIYLKFAGRLGNVLFEFTGIYGLKRKTDSQVRFVQNRLIPKLIKLFPRTKPLLKTVHILPSGLLKLHEQKGGQFDPSLAQKIIAAKSDVQVSTFLSRFFYIFVMSIMSSNNCATLGKHLNP